MYTLSCFADEISPNLNEQLDEMEIVAQQVQIVVAPLLGAVQQAGIIRNMAPPEILGPMGVDAVYKVTYDWCCSKGQMNIREHARRAVEIARLMGCPRVRVFSFYMDKNELDARRGEVMDRLGKMADIAADAGVILMHENEAGIYGEKSARCEDIVKSVNHPALRAVFDPSNFVAAGEAPFDECLPRLRDAIVYMHIKDSRRSDGVIVPAGEGDAQLREILPVFAGEDMFLTLEPHLAVAGRMRGFTGPELFEKAHKALTGLLEAAGIAYN